MGLRVWNPTTRFQPRSVSVLLRGAGQFDPVSSTDLSDVPWDLAAYSGAFVSWEFQDILQNEVFVHGVIDTLTATPVPEPGVGASFAVFVFALGFLRRRS